MIPETHDRPQVPEALASRIFIDFQPVRPVLPIRARALIVIAIAVIAAAGLLAANGLRADLAALPADMFAGMVMIRILLGVSLIGLALGEAIPAGGHTARWRSAWLTAGVGGLFVLPAVFAALIGSRSHDATLGPWFCFPFIIAVSVPSFIVVNVLLRRGYALCPIRAGLIAGLGTGILAEAAQFAACANSAVGHQWLMHGGAVVSLAALGAIVGWFESRTRSYDSE